MSSSRRLSSCGGLPGDEGLDTSGEGDKTTDGTRPWPLRADAAVRPSDICTSESAGEGESIELELVVAEGGDSLVGSHA